MKKTNETSLINLICRKCNGNGTPSKAYRNYHNIDKSFLKGEVEFETKLIDCIKCESCGHSWIPEKSIRKLALEWWNNLIIEKQIGLGFRYFNNKNYYSIIGREIEQIYYNEVIESKLQENWQESQANQKYSEPKQKQYTQKEVDDLLDRQVAQTVSQILKNNQKQFKELNSELFKSYINKFSEEDKFKATVILLENQKEEYKFNCFITALKQMNLDSSTQSNIMTLVALRNV